MGQRGRRPGGEGSERGLIPAITLDLSEAEQFCGEPSPLDQVRRAVEQLPPGQLLEVRSRIADHAFSVRVWARRNGFELVADVRQGGVHVLWLRAPR